MTNLFVSIYNYFTKHKLLLFSLLAIVVFICVFLSTQIKFSEDISNFLPEDKQNEQVNYAYQHIGAANTIIVYFSLNDSTQEAQDVLPEAIDEYINSLNNKDIEPYIKKIQYTIDESAIIEKMDFISKNIPYFLDKEDYVKIEELITKENIYKQLEYNRNMLGTVYGGMMKNVIVNDPLFISGELLAGLEQFKMNDNFSMVDGYIYTKEGNRAIVRIESKYPLSETANNKILTNLIDEAAEETAGKFANISIKPFGAAYISVNNAEQIKKDSFLTIAIAVILIIVILIYSFRSIRIILSFPAALAFGMLFALGITSLFFKEVSLIAIGISSVIIGIAANYPLHFLDHKYHAFSTRQTLKDIVTPLTIGNITTVGAFLSLLFISSPAMKNLGVFSSMLLIGTILFVLVVMPHIVKDKSPYYTQSPKRILKRFTDIPFEEHRYLFWIVIVFTVIFSFLDKAGFDADMSKINYMTDEHRSMMQQLTKDTEDNSTTIYVVADADNIDKSLENYEHIFNDLQKMTENDSTIRLTSIGKYLPSKSKQKERIELWNSFWKDKDIYPIIEDAAQNAGFKKNAFDNFKNIISTNHEIHDLQYFKPLYNDLAENYIIEGEERSMIFSILHVQEEDLNTVKNNLQNNELFSQNNVFVFSQESIMSQIVNTLSDNFDYVLYICSFIVLIFLFISFGRIELTVISFLPLAIGWIWILAIMNIFGMNFNIVNIILATFIFGMGDDYTIFMTEGCIYENRFGKKMLNTYKSTVALSAIIMFIGIGTLILAKHPAMKQLGEVVIIGMFTVVLTAFIIPSSLFKWLTTKKGEKRTVPITIKNLLFTSFAFIVFLLGALYLDILGIIILTIGGKTDKHKLIYHRHLQWISKFITYHIPKSKCTFENKSGEDNPFEKPSIIVCNHQSHLDLMAVLSLSPKIIVVTNHWVWRAPFYGWIIRYADFYPAERFEQNDLSSLKKMTEKGYSILVFPEGTRSHDCSIQRFHKGAFFMAQQLGLDILPVMIHGFGHILPKKYLSLQSGDLSIQIMQRISSQNIDYQQLCKNTNKLYRDSYKLLCQSIETVDYYAKDVINNYLYKGKDVETYVRRSLSKNNNYKDLVKTIPQNGKIILTNVGKGEVSLLAALVRKDVYFNAYIDNEEDYLTAVNCASVPKNLHYTYSEQIPAELESEYDKIIDCHGK